MARWCMRRKWNLNYMCLMGDTVFYSVQLSGRHQNEKIFLLHVATNNTPVRAWGNNGESLFTDLGKGYPYTVGTGDFTVGSPASAKNVIAVGAYATRICPVNVDGGTSYLAGNSLGELTSFSSVGPTLDNRMKPDITAPGLWVASSL